MRILDATCGKRMMWFNKFYEDCVYMDIRREVGPDLVADFRMLPFPDETFDLVVFDPPHDVYRSGHGIFRRKFGGLQSGTVHIDLYRAARELFRVLKPNGFLSLNGTRIVTSLSQFYRYSPNFHFLDSEQRSEPNIAAPLTGLFLSNKEEILGEN